MFNIGTGVVTDSDGLASMLREVFPNAEVDVTPGPEVAFTPHRPQPLDIGRARRVLGYEPTRLGAIGIQRFVDDLQRTGEQVLPVSQNAGLPPGNVGVGQAVPGASGRQGD